MKCSLDMEIFEMTHRPFIYETMASKSDNFPFSHQNTNVHTFRRYDFQFFFGPKHGNTESSLAEI